MRRSVLAACTIAVLAFTSARADIPAPSHPVSNQTLTAFTGAVALVAAGVITWVSLTVTQTHPVPVHVEVQNANEFPNISLIAYFSEGQPRVFRVTPDSPIPQPAMHRAKRYLLYAQKSWLDSAGLGSLSIRELAEITKAPHGKSAASSYPVHLLGEAPYEYLCGKSDRLKSEDLLYRLCRNGNAISLFLRKKTSYYPDTEQSEVFEQTDKK